MRKAGTEEIDVPLSVLGQPTNFAVSSADTSSVPSMRAVVEAIALQHTARQ